MMSETYRTWLHRVVHVIAVGFVSMACIDVASAGWREDMGTFRIGMVADSGPTARAEIVRAYSMALGVPVEIVVAKSYPALIEAQASGRIEYAIYSTLAFATASVLCSCVEPVAAPVSADGATGLRAVLITRDERLRSIEDLPQRRVGLAAEDDVAALINSSPDLQPVLAKAGANIVHTGSASAMEAMLADGSLDGIFGWISASEVRDQRFEGGTLDRLRLAGVDPDSLSVIWTSDLLRYGPHAIRNGLDPEIGASLTILLTAMFAQNPDLYDLIERDRQGGFRKVNAADYTPAVAAVRQMAKIAE